MDKKWLIIIIVILVVWMYKPKFLGGISVGYCPNTPCTDTFSETKTIVARGTNEDVIFNCDGGYDVDKYMDGSASADKTGIEGLKISAYASGCQVCGSASASTICKSNLNLTNYKTIEIKSKLSRSNANSAMQAGSSSSSGITGYGVSGSCPFGYGTGATQYPCPEYESSFNGWTKLQKTSTGTWDIFFKKCETCELVYSGTSEITEISLSVNLGVDGHASATASSELEWIKLEAITACNTIADTNCDGGVTKSELQTAGNNWIAGQITRQQLAEAAAVWSSSSPLIVNLS